MINALSIDVEDYFQVSNFAGVIKYQDWDKFESRVEKNTKKLLAILNEYNVKATFFVLGWVAERFPELVKSITDQGHEVATHGYAHQLIYNQNPQQFREDLKKSIHILEGVSKTKPLGYRAPSYSIVNTSLWALDVLIEEDIEYDSSIFPIRRDRYGIANSARFPHRISRGQNGSIVEFPLSTIRVLGNNIPVAGGGYFRLFPYWFIHLAIRKINAQGHPAIIYLHPWEIDTQQPRIKAKLMSQFRHYVNLNKTEDKFRRLLSDFHFAPIRKILENQGLI